MNIYERIYEYLISHGIQQKFVAEKCGWTKVKMHHLMHGSQRMTIDEYIMICHVLGLPFGYFGDDTTTPPAVADGQERSEILKKDDLDLAFSVMETAAVRLHANTPLFSGMAELAESDEWFRKELIRALLLSADLLRRAGAEVEETPLLARVRRAYTST